MSTPATLAKQNCTKNPEERARRGGRGHQKVQWLNFCRLARQRTFGSRSSCEGHALIAPIHKKPVKSGGIECMGFLMQKTYRGSVLQAYEFRIHSNCSENGAGFCAINHAAVCVCVQLYHYMSTVWSIDQTVTGVQQDDDLEEFGQRANQSTCPRLFWTRPCTCETAWSRQPMHFFLHSCLMSVGRS